jgi:hypothetical protein
MVPVQILQLWTTLKGQYTVNTVYRFDLQGPTVVRVGRGCVWVVWE